MRRTVACVLAGTWGQQAFDCPFCHTTEMAGGPFVCVGEGTVTLEHGLLSKQFTDDPTVVVSDPAAADSEKAALLCKAGARVLLDSVVSATKTPSGNLTITTRGGHELPAKLTLLSGVKRPHTELATAIGLERDEHGYPVTSPFGRTSNRLVWNAGNVSDQYLMWTGAASSGLNAAVSMCEELSFGDGKR